MISNHLAQTIKDAAQIEEVVGQFVELKKKGSRYLTHCPFHNEKTPSFNVTPSMGIYKCFGCGEAGDSVSFLMRHEHMNYPEALKWIAKFYNIEVVEEEATPEDKIEQDERESLSVIQQFALRWTQQQLWETDEGKRIGLSYFRERGMTDEIIREFQLGYVPESGHAFVDQARDEGYQDDLLVKAGWIKVNSDGRAWDFFQGRVTFPIFSLSGQPIAFGARTLRSDKKLAKYFNSPESLLYYKSKVLYGIYAARKTIVSEDTCFLVEGYTDVISMHQAGIKNVVASSGTSLTQDQVRLIKRYSKNVTILYDGDPAGIKASLRGIDLILAEGLNVKVVLFPEGDDPDSFAKKHEPHEIIEFLTTKAQDLIVFKTGLLLEDAQNDPVKKAALIHDIVNSIAQIPDQVLRSLYVKECSNLLEIGEQALLSELNKALRNNLRKQSGYPQELPPPIEVPTPTPVQEIKDLGTMPQERDLLRMLMNYGNETILAPIDGTDEEEEMTVAALMFELLAVDDIHFDDPVLLEIYLDMRHRTNLDQDAGAGYYSTHENGAWRNVAIELLAEKHELSGNWLERHKIHVVREKDRLLAAVEEGVHILKERRVDRMLREIQDRLKDCTDESKQKDLLMDQMRLIEAKKALAKETGRVVVG
jgi:DNA primase